MSTDEDPSIALSLCGGLQSDMSETEMEAAFQAKVISFDEFSADPSSVLGNPDLVIRIDEKYYNWAVGWTLHLPQRYGVQGHLTLA